MANFQWLSIWLAFKNAEMHLVMKPRQGLCIQNDLLQCALVQYLQKS